MIAIIDYDAGNLKSVQKALDFLHQECVITRDFHEIRQADKVILPGVGSFGEAMAQLKKYELDKVIQEVAEEKKPFLGICLGLQLLFEGSLQTVFAVFSTVNRSIRKKNWLCPSGYLKRRQHNGTEYF